MNKNILKYDKKTFVVSFLARVLYIPKNIGTITKNKW